MCPDWRELLALGVLPNLVYRYYMMHGLAPESFQRWRELLERARHEAATLRSILIIQRTDTEESRRWRDFSPFAGVLNAKERRAIIRQCNYSH